MGDAYGRTAAGAAILTKINEEGCTITKRFYPGGTLDALSGINSVLNDPTGRMARDLQDSPLMRTVRELQGSPAVLAAHDLQDSPLMRTVRDLQDTPLMRTVRELQGSPAMRAAHDLQDSPLMRTVRDLQDTPLMRTVRELQDSPAVHVTRNLQDSSVTRVLRGLESCSIMASLTRLSGAPFEPELIHQAVAIAHHVNRPRLSEQEGVPEELTAAEAELHNFGDGNVDFSSLSESGRRALLWLFYWIVLPFLLNIAAAAALERFNERAAGSVGVTTSHDAKRLARCNNGLEREIFAGCRVVTGDGLRLRAAPNMNAQVITNLPLGKLLVVLDSSARAWLLVEVEIEDELIEGWVARRYTTQFR